MDTSLRCGLDRPRTEQPQTVPARLPQASPDSRLHSFPAPRGVVEISWLTLYDGARLLPWADLGRGALMKTVAAVSRDALCTSAGLRRSPDVGVGFLSAPFPSHKPETCTVVWFKVLKCPPGVRVWVKGVRAPQWIGNLPMVYSGGDRWGRRELCSDDGIQLWESY